MYFLWNIMWIKKKYVKLRMMLIKNWKCVFASMFLSCGFFLLFFFFLICSIRTCWLFYNKQYIYVLFTDPQILLFSNFFIKNGSHGTIYIFKNYFTSVFLVSVFSFSKNKLNPNGPIGDGSSLVSSCICLLVGCVFVFYGGN